MIYEGYTLILLSILTFFYLVDTIIKKVGVQTSISASFYELESGEKLFFKATLIFFPIFLILGFLLINYHFFEEKRYIDIVAVFFCCMGTSFVGAAAAFRDKPITNTFHLVGVWSSVAIGYAYLIYTGQYDVFIISVIGVFLSHRYTKHPVFYDEIVAFSGITYGLIRISLGLI